LDSAFDLSDLLLIGHVAGVGDVRAGLNHWIAGPNAPSRIEGLSIIWPNKPSSFDLRYSVTTARPHPMSQRFVTTGQYAGTRGKALAVVGLAIEIDGAGAAGAQLSVEAFFLGSPSVRRIGQRIFLAGPTGREPLVGLKLALELATSVSEMHLPRQPTPQPTSVGRVRVFRGRNRPDPEFDDPSRKFARPA
jgi:hypothetical protein